MKVSVIVPVFNEEAYITDCLKCIFDQEEKADEVIVVNNNCTDNTLAIVNQFPVRVVNEERQGMIYSRNKGFDSARYPLLLRTDADARVPRNWIKRIKIEFGDETISALSGPSRFYETAFAEKISALHRKLYFPLLIRILGNGCLYGPNMSIRKEIWDQVRDDVCLKDSMVHEDIDLTIHIALYGKIAFDPTLIIDVSFRRLKKFSFYYNYPYRYIRTIQRHRIDLHKIRSTLNSLVNVFLFK